MSKSENGGSTTLSATTASRNLTGVVGGVVNKPVVSSSASNARLSSSVNITAVVDSSTASDSNSKALGNNVATKIDSKTADIENDQGVIAEREKKIVNEFVYLLDKSKQLFNGLK